KPKSVDLTIDPEKTLEKLENFLKEKLESSGFEGYIVGLSGGIDSSLTATIAVNAVGLERVLGLSMPHGSAAPDSGDLISKLTKMQGLKVTEIDISRMITAYYTNIKTVNPVRLGNKVSRERMSILFDQAFESRLLVLGASNRTEIALGYMTWFGNTASSVNLLGQLYKTQIRQLAMHLKLPKEIIETPPTADLWPGQTDEEELGLKYDEVDKLLALMVDHNIQSRTKLAEYGFDDATMDRTIALANRYYFKRRCPDNAFLGLPDIPDTITLKK
ncbi:MAG: NAD+ synthase, partial [candidate division Zixibacteria bacterium]|nr:NAD+ synthase [candidate division Zixibacteria bacterium]